MESSDDSSDDFNRFHSFIDAMGNFHYRVGRSLGDCIGSLDSESDLGEIFGSIRGIKFYDNIWRQIYQISELNRNEYGNIVATAKLGNGIEETERLDFLTDNLVVE